MKRKLQLFLTLIFTVIVFAFSACQKTTENFKAEVVESSESIVVIRVDETDGNASLYEVMCALKEQGELNFVSEDSTYGQSIVSINGVENPADWSSYWVSYTTDSENGSTGKTVDGVEWYYAMAGISSLKVKAGHSYMFAYEQSSF